MDVNVSNFNSILDEVQDSLHKCAFVAIDTEFTALNTNIDDKVTSFDDAEQIYQKYKANFKDVQICQVGLSIFDPHKVHESYIAKTYSFHVCPRSFLSNEPKILCQASSLEFLTKHDFNFSQWIVDGLPCLDPVSEKNVRRDFQKFMSTYSSQRVSREVSSQLTLLNEWKHAEAEGASPLIDLESPTEIMHFMVGVYKEHKDLIAHLSSSGEVKVSRSEVQNRDHVCLLEINAALDTFIRFYKGFLHVFDSIRYEKKPIVCHNGLADVILLFQQMVGPLPDTLLEFQEELQENLPYIYDTKEIAHHLHKTLKDEPEWRFLRKTDLKSLTTKFQSMKFEDFPYMPWVTHHPSTPAYENEKNLFHCAGFDALCTGTIFIHMAHIKAMLEITPELRKELQRPLSAYDLVGAVTQYSNKLPTQNASIKVLALTGDQEKVRDTHWMVLKARASVGSLCLDDVSQTLGQIARLDMKPIDSRSVILNLHRKSVKNFVISSLKNHEKYKLIKYNAYLHSPVIRRSLWSVALISIGLCAGLGFQLRAKLQ